MGNSQSHENIGGSLSPELLGRILEKAVREKNINYVGLYNWTEPLLHPRIGDLINVVKSFGLPCFVSTNLNISKRLEAVVAAAPAFFRISVSGFSNGVYQKHHKGGDIETVKSNMRLLSELVKKYKPKTHIEVFYLRWLGNMDDELLMQAYAQELGFNFQATWAWLSPVEKQIAIAKGDFSQVSSEDLDTLNSLAPPFHETLAISKKYADVGRCHYFDEYIVLDCAGRLSLCCAVFDQELYTIGNYLDHNFEELTRMKKEMPSCKSICQQCMQRGLQFVNMGQPEFHAIAVANTLNHYANRLGARLVQ